MPPLALPLVSGMVQHCSICVELEGPLSLASANRSIESDITYAAVYVPLEGDTANQRS